MTAAVHTNGGRIFARIMHAGRRSHPHTTGMEPVGPSAVAAAGEEVLLDLRRTWPGTLIMNPVLPTGAKQTDRTDADHWLGLGADLISFGRAFLANPDLVERLRNALPIAPVDRAAFYQGGDAGYLTYPAYQYAA